MTDSAIAHGVCFEPTDERPVVACFDRLGNSLGGSAVLLPVVGDGLGLFASLAGLHHAVQRYENGGEPVEAAFAGTGVAIERTARSMVGMRASIALRQVPTRCPTDPSSGDDIAVCTISSIGHPAPGPASAVRAELASAPVLCIRSRGMWEVVGIGRSRTAAAEVELGSGRQAFEGRALPPRSRSPHGVFDTHGRFRPWTDSHRSGPRQPVRPVRLRP